MKTMSAVTLIATILVPATVYAPQPSMLSRRRLLSSLRVLPAPLSHRKVRHRHRSPAAPFLMRRPVETRCRLR
jgi:hypothetical protein